MCQIFYLCLAAAFGLLINTVAMSGRAEAAGLGKTCGGIAGIPCNKGLWCEHKPGMCRVADALGKCVKVPKFCHYIYRPVCGCNGKTYGNDCARRRAKVQKAHDGPCKKHFRPARSSCCSSCCCG